ncbi:MAG: tetratricopeptide repeat protein [Verrucomicrobia bacterium]|nr:tetratricopeptide repeat protein [Verrucomicrobiota bacterium]
MSHPRLVGLLLALITLVAYLPVRQHEFVTYDDNDYITENLVVQNGLTPAGVEWAFTTWHASNWHPLTWLSHMLDCELFDLDAGAHHLVNALIHTANAILLLALLLRLTGNLWPAAIVAALFAWHPLHVESVAWASERKDVLSAFFALLTLLAYAGYVEKSKAWNAPAKFYHGGALLFFALGLLAKPMLVTLPFVLLLLDWWPLQRLVNSKSQSSFRLVLEKWPFFLLSAVSCVITFLAQRGSAVLTVEQHSLHLRAGNALLSCANYLLKTVWPVNLAIPYPLPASLPIASVFVSAAVLALISWLVWRARRDTPSLLIGWLWFLGMLVPVIGIVQVGRQAMADRYTYLPHIGLFIAVVYGFQNLTTRWHIKSAALFSVVGAILAACLLGTELQLRFWLNSEILFTHTLAVTKNNAIAHINLGVALEQKGRRDDALFQYRAALRIDPGYVQAHNNLAILLDAMDHNDEALAEYQEALRLNPKAALAHCNLGTLLVKLGRFDEASSHYSEAARLAPNDPRPHYLKGKAELRRSQSAAAITHFRDALQRNPNDLRTLTFLARVLASDNNAQVRTGAEAVVLAERANTLTGGGDAFVLDTLAMAYAEAGRFVEAQRTIQAALDLAKTTGETPPPALQQRQQLYLANRAFRETATNQPPEPSSPR